MFGRIPRFCVYQSVPLVCVAFATVPPRQRREVSPSIVSSIISFAGFTNAFLPQIPLPDVSKLKKTLLPKSVQAAPRFERPPDADLVVSLHISEYITAAAVHW